LPSEYLQAARTARNRLTFPTASASLDQANLKSVSIIQDRDKGVVTLGGQVTADADKA